MPTIKQLPSATSVGAADLLPLSQSGVTKGLAVGSLLSSVQPAIGLATGKLLGRVSATAGGPEPVGVGTGLSVAGGALAATGADHAGFAVSAGLLAGDEVVINSAGIPKRMQAIGLRSLFTAGSGVTIDGSGTISAIGGGGSGSVALATAVAPGVVKVGAGLSVSAQGTLTADGSVVALRSSLAAVAMSGSYGDLAGLPVLGGAAGLGVGTVTGTVAAGDDSRIKGAVQAAALGAGAVKATGGVMARSLADHLGDRLTVADLGVAGTTPTVDQSAALQAVQNALQAAGGGTLRVTSGSYLVGSNVYTAETNAWLFERGVTLGGTGQIDAVTDGQALGASGLTLARLLSGTSDEHGLHVSLRLAPTTGGTGYEKTAVYGRLIQNDPSSYDASGNLVTIRDAVVVEAQASIPAGNMTGRVWGINTSAGPDAGGDGYAVGAEIGVQSSSGRDAGRLGTATSKIGVHVVAYGNSTATAAVVFSGNGTTFQDGVVAQTNAVASGGRALSVRPAGSTRASDIAYIGMDGSAAFTSLTVGGVAVGAGGTSAAAPVVPVTTVAASGAAQTLTAATRGACAFDVTLTANCVLSLAGGSTGQLQVITLFLRQDATAGRVPSLPGGVKWPGGIVPTPNSAAGVIDVFTFTTPDGGATWFGSY